MALYHTSICRNWYAEQFPLSACKFQLSEYRWNEFLDTACYFDFGRNWIICVYILGDSFLLQTSGSIKEVQNRMNWLSAAWRQKKTRQFRTATLIFRAAVSLFSFALYFYSANHAPYTYIDVIFLGPLCSFIGIVISIISRKSRKIHPALWISGIISCMLGFIVCMFVLSMLIVLMAAK